MIKVNEAVWFEDGGVLQVVHEDDVVEHIYPTEVNGSYSGYALQELERLLYEKPMEYAELVLNGEVERFAKLCQREESDYSKFGREFLMYEN